MGGGSYKVEGRALRSATLDYASKSTHELFTKRQIQNGMNPKGVKIRESRDSTEHPNSIAIILGLDVTGSMGSIPTYLIKEGLPNIMGKIIQAGIDDPQLLFMGIGDHECDRSPLQVAQFESSDELLDKWLEDVYLEGGGGGNYGESYHLAWYFAAQHTSIDCYDKRGQKGFLFTIGDEPVLDNIPSLNLKGIMGDGQYVDYNSSELLALAREKYHVIHIHIDHGRGLDERWKNLMGQDVVVIQKPKDISQLIPKLIMERMGFSKDLNNEKVVSKKISWKDKDMDILS